MPTLNFTQFSAPATIKPATDYVVGYNNLNDGSNLEARYSFDQLAAELLPKSGLGTKMHQIKKLARMNFEATYSMAAVTKREEVICWGQNIKQNPFLNVAPYNIAARNIASDQQYTKFGAGFPSFDRVPHTAPIVIPFMRGLPTDNNQDIINLQEAGLTIEDIIWDQWASMARLSDGSIWVKALLGPNEAVGFNPVDMPSTTYFSAAYFKIPDNFFVLTAGSTLSALAIETLPKGRPICGGLFLVLDQNYDLHLWGSTSGTSPGYSLWPGDPTKFQATMPVNITKDFVDLRNNVREFRVCGDMSNLGVEFIQVINRQNKLYSLGYNGNGNLGTGEDTAYTAATWNKSNWTQSRYLDPDNGNVKTFVNNAWKFVHGKFNSWHTGYLSVSSSVDGSNRIFVTGQNELGTGTNLYPAAIGATTPPVGANVYAVAPGGTSSNWNPFVKGLITGDHTMILLTKCGSVHSSGRNKWGEAGTTAVGPTLNRVTYKAFGVNQTPHFGQQGQLSAVDVYTCNDSVEANITGIKVLNPNGKTQLYLAGNYCFTTQNNSFAIKDSTFKLFPLKENVVDVRFGGTINTNHWHMILTDTGRTYGVGFGPFGLISESSSLQSTPNVTTTYVVKSRNLWYQYYTSYVITQWTWNQTYAWSPQPIVIF